MLNSLNLRNQINVSDEKFTDFEVECRICYNKTLFTLESEGLLRWKNGEKIQNIFPMISPNNRELLISQTCGECFDKLFAEE